MVYKFNQCPSRIIVSNWDKLKLAKMIIEKEKRGWECIKPLHKRPVMSTYVDRYKQTHYFSKQIYAVVMQKVNRSVV